MIAVLRVGLDGKMTMGFSIVGRQEEIFLLRSVRFLHGVRCRTLQSAGEMSIKRVVIVSVCILEGETKSSIRTIPASVAFVSEKYKTVMIPMKEFEGDVSSLRAEAHAAVNDVFNSYEDLLPYPDGDFPLKHEKRGGEVESGLTKNC